MKVLIEWLKTFCSFICGPQLPKQGTIVDIIMAQTRDFGPSLRTGGVLHAIDRDEAVIIGDLIETEAPKQRLEPAFVLAGLVGESRCDPNAINPNYQDRKPDETSDEALLHMDVGIAQFDIRTLRGDAKLATLNNEQLKTLATLPSFAIPRFCEVVRKLLDDANKEVAFNPSLLDGVPGRDVRVLAVEGYNTGEHGARLHAQLNEGKGDGLSYGAAWLARYNTYSAILKQSDT